MSGLTIGLVGFAVMLVLIALRAPIGLAMLLVGAAGYAWMSGPHVLLAYMKTNAYHQFANYTLSVIPLFILMGALAERAGIASALFKSAERLIGRQRGGLSMAVIGACTGFGAICGSSVATTATFGRAALPELQRYGYNGGFATGTIAIGGTLGILIPPSVILVVYAITTEQNIAKLFQAALIPGLLAALFYCITIAIVAARDPSLAPAVSGGEIVEGRARRPRWQLLLGVAGIAAAASTWQVGMLSTSPALLLATLAILALVADAAILPALAVAVTVVGGIYGGIFTPTEAAAVGTITMLLIGLLQRTLGPREVVAAIRQTAETSGMIFIILLGAEVFGAFLGLSKLPEIAAQSIAGLGVSPYLVLILMLALYILLGAVMDELAMILLTLPVFFPIIQGLNFGLPAEEVGIWFGILVLIVVGMGLAAPPIGLNVFVISSMAPGVPISDTYRGVLPFLLADLIRLSLVLAFPALALWLVRLLA